MEEVNYDELIKIVEESTKQSYLADEIKDKPVPNVANLGARRGDVAKLLRHGEYYGIGIEFLENAVPLLTDRFVVRLLGMLKKEDYVTPLTLLGLTAIEQLQYILHTWFQTAVVDYNNQLAIGLKKKYPLFDPWIKSVTHDPILVRIKLVDVGYNENTGQPVVPIEWLDREFANGYDLHREMDKLESRIGRPPVTYAVIYSMIIQKPETIITNTKDVSYDKIFYLDVDGDSVSSTITTKPRKDKTYQYVKYENILVGFITSEILEPKGKNEQTNPKLREVGLLVSRLQKCIRRGRYASKVLVETIHSLNESPNYNLPEHNFLRVSASKQLVWRLFISILEDCRPYQAIKELGLLEIVLLVLITQKLQEYKFTEKILRLIKLTAILAQYNDTPNDLYDWHTLEEASKTPIKPDSPFHNALSLVLDNIIMMGGDNYMLRKYYSEKKIFEPFIYPNELKSGWKSFLDNNKYLYNDKKVYEDTILASYDMHNKTHIILYYQACIPVSLTTKQISGYIWNVSSSYNVRSGKKKPKPDPILRSIQIYFYKESKSHRTLTRSKLDDNFHIDKIKPDINIKRTSFLVLFGRKYRFKGKEIVLAGTKEKPCRVKIDNEWTYYGDDILLNSYPKQIINLSEINPPIGYRWTKDKVTTEIIRTKPMVDGNPIPYFDGTSILESITPSINKIVNKTTRKWVVELFSGLDIKFNILLMFRTEGKKELLNWLPSQLDAKKLNTELIQLTYTKIFNNFNNIIMVGPVDRSGNKMQNSINYLLEGKLWAIFNFFCYLYPGTVEPHGATNFKISKETPGYVHLVTTLEKMLFDDKKITGTIPRIKTTLWDHQIESSNKIIAGFDRGKHGYGDASGVGAGKTFISLNIAAELIRKNNHTYSGILVLLPGNKLIKTWEDELNKHTEGFDVIFQENNSDIGEIKRNTIVVTTMARIRDHPINHKWLLLIIDECLTVQNRNALWTEAAWKQSLMSKHLVMMSATFFRTRFDKLYYMLKMLQTGLPERKEYLDAILLESIVSQISKVSRKWISHFNYFELGKESRREYDEIDSIDMKTETKFSKLTSFLVNDPDVNETVVVQLGELIKRLEKTKHRCLIYAYAKKEAEFWSERLNIPIYPTKGKHCIVTYHDGTYGLNDLIIYDTIVMRPPQPDKLPQIKGRVDRPGQQSDTLWIEYFVLRNTIEEGLILRMNIASKFVQTYIMPLSKFYDISIHHKKYTETEDEE